MRHSGLEAMKRSPVSRLILILGTDAEACARVASSLRKAGLSAGWPFPVFENPLSGMRMPAHGALVFWRAVRRFFGDLGLPPIAEPPQALISAMRFEFQVGLFRRIFLQMLQNGPYVCADHLASLMLPVLRDALAAEQIRYRSYFLFSNPAREMAALASKGQPAQLSEFVWRNIVASAVRHGGSEISFINIEEENNEPVKRMLQDICAFYGLETMPEIILPPLAQPLRYADATRLSPLTARLYENLLAYARHGAWRGLEEAAFAAYAAQAEQNGWQFWNCLDCGDLRSCADLMLNEGNGMQAGESCGQEDESAETSPLEKLQMRMLELEQEFAAKLFMHTDSLSRFYADQLDDLRARHELEMLAFKERCDRYRERRKIRLRKLWNLRAERS